MALLSQNRRNRRRDCRHGSRERLLARVCGTVPYAAPEVLRAAAAPYRAAPADLWAAALVLLAMLAGGERARPPRPAAAPPPRRPPRLVSLVS